MRGLGHYPKENYPVSGAASGIFEQGVSNRCVDQILIAIKMTKCDTYFPNSAWVQN